MLIVEELTVALEVEIDTPVTWEAVVEVVELAMAAAIALVLVEVDVDKVDKMSEI